MTDKPTLEEIRSAYIRARLSSVQEEQVVTAMEFPRLLEICREQEERIKAIETAVRFANSSMLDKGIGGLFSAMDSGGTSKQPELETILDIIDRV